MGCIRGEALDTAPHGDLGPGRAELVAWLSVRPLGSAGTPQQEGCWCLSSATDRQEGGVQTRTCVCVYVHSACECTRVCVYMCVHARSPHVWMPVRARACVCICTCAYMGVRSGGEGLLSAKFRPSAGRNGELLRSPEMSVYPKGRHENHRRLESRRRLKSKSPAYTQHSVQDPQGRVTGRRGQQSDVDGWYPLHPPAARTAQFTPSPRACVGPHGGRKGLERTPRRGPSVNNSHVPPEAADR